MQSKQKQILVVGIVLLFFLLLVQLLSPHVKKVSTHRQIAFGAWTEGLIDGPTQTLHPEKLAQFENLIHKKVSIAHYYIGWEALENPKLIKQFATLRSNGWEPMLNVNPYYFPDCPPTDSPLYQAIAQGKCDTFLHKAGKNLSHVNQPFYLLFAWEMNNKDNSWSIPYTGSTNKDFIAAWRHMHAIFKQEGARNVVWVFCPNVPDVSDISYKSLYPGDEYVDWLGLDGYNWGTTQSWSQWTSFAGVFGGSYKTITALAPGKPLMLAEVNTTDKGGNKAAWYTDMLTRQIPTRFTKISAIVIFNEDRSKQEKVNWKVDATPSSLQAFIAAIHAQYYQ